jgi:hypothetical protein
MLTTVMRIRDQEPRLCFLHDWPQIRSYLNSWSTLLFPVKNQSVAFTFSCVEKSDINLINKEKVS